MNQRILTQSLAVTLVAGLAACSAAAPAVPTPAPTVKAIATQVAPEVRTAAPTVAAIATQLRPTVVPAVGTVVAASPVAITDVSLKPGAATLTLTNTGATTFDVSGFVLRVGNANVKLPANADLSPGEKLTLHTAVGTSQGNDIYLGAEAAQLFTALKPGATVELATPQGATVTRFQLPAA